MAITYGTVTENYYNSTAVGTISFVHNNGSLTDGLLVVGVSIVDTAPSITPDVSSVSWGGTALTKATDAIRTNGNNDYVSEIWYLTGVNGSGTVQVIYAAANIAKSYIVASGWNGCHQTQGTVLASFNQGTGTTDPSVAITPGEDNCLIVSQYCSESNNVLSPSGETLLIEEDMGAQVAGASYIIQTTNTAQTVDFTGTDSDWSMAVGAFRSKPASPTLTVGDSVHIHAADNVALTQLHTLTVGDSVHAHISDNAVVSQVSDLVPGDSYHAHTADNLTLEVSTNAVPDESVHITVSDNVSLTQLHSLAAGKAVHAHVSDNIILAQAHNLSAGEAIHAHTADNVTLAQTHILAAGECVHITVSDNVITDSSAFLAVGDSVHVHAADNVTLSQVHRLTVGDSIHAHAADGITLAQVHSITVADAVHAHVSDTVMLTQLHTLAVGECAHVHISDNLTVTESSGDNLIVADVYHVMVSDNIASLTEIFPVKRRHEPPKYQPVTVGGGKARGFIRIINGRR